MDKPSLKNGSAALVTRALHLDDQLSYEDRETLRAIIRKHHKRYFADHPTNVQCDQLIEAFSAEVRLKMIKASLP